MIPYYPGAIKDELGDAGNYLGGPYRGVLHTTEGASYAGARGSYVQHRSNPHFTVNGSMVWQHCAINRAARSMQNKEGGVETNRQSCIQIEVVGFAANPVWTPDTIESTRRVMEWCEKQTGIRPTAPRFLAYPASYGYKAPQRMGNQAWLRWDGWCGHEHVPENDHGDPGACPITALLVRGPLTMDQPKPQGAPMAAAPFSCVLTHPNGGYLEIGEDGGVFAWGDPAAPFFGSLGGIKLNQPIVDAAWTPDYGGYYLLAKDGGIFAFGNAKHQGNALWSG